LNSAAAYDFRVAWGRYSPEVNRVLGEWNALVWELMDEAPGVMTNIERLRWAMDELARRWGFNPWALLP
jgi:hypothetical protein